MGWLCLAHHTSSGCIQPSSSRGGARRAWGWERGGGCGRTAGRQGCPTPRGSKRGQFHFFLCSDFRWFWGGSGREAGMKNQGAGARRWALASADAGPGDRGLWLRWRHEAPAAPGGRDLVPGTKNTDIRMGTCSSAGLSRLGIVQHWDVVREPREGAS